MNPVRTYSSFPALLLFFAAVTVMDVDQMTTVHAKKLVLMDEYRRSLKLQHDVEAQTRWVGRDETGFVAACSRRFRGFGGGDGHASAAGEVDSGD